jgi:nitrite reductase [NAD(P)H] small subunit
MIWRDVAAVADVKDQFGLGVRVDGLAIALFRDGDAVYATEGSCPHRGGILSDGIVRDGTVICPLHAWQFRLADGSHTDDGPGIRTYPVRIACGRILVGVEPEPPPDRVV